MNLIFLADQHFPNGMAGSKRIRLFAEYLANKNKVKVLIISNTNGNNEKRGNIRNVSFEFTKFTKFQNLFAYKKMKNLLKINYSVGEKNILFLYDNITITNFLFAYIGRKLGYKIITDIVEDYSLSQEDESIKRKIQYKLSAIIQRRLNIFVDGVVLVSEYLFKKYSYISNHILISVSAENLGVNFEKKEKDGDIKMVYSGSFGNKDGVADLISAFKIVAKKFENIQLILAGKINGKVSEVIAEEKKIKYVGLIPHDKYYDFLNDADILLMTRENSAYANAGFPFKLGEYLATGKPVIATKVSDIEIYLKDKEDAILAMPSDIDSLVTAFEYAIVNFKDSKRIGQNGKEKCKLFFDPIRNGEKLEIFLKNI